MTQLLWTLLYLILAVVFMPLFTRIEYSKRVQKDYTILTDRDSPAARKARTDSVYAGIISGLFWPVMLVATLVFVLIYGLAFKVPKEVRREMELREARRIIEEYEKEWNKDE